MSNLRRILIFALLISSISLPLAAQFQFGLPTVSDCEADSREMVFINLNEDDFIDLAVISFANGEVTPMLGDGFGKFNCFYPIAVGDFPTDIATGNFDGDDFADLVIINQEPQDEMVFLYGKGDGIFDELISLDVGSPNDVLVNDFNLDEQDDLAIAEGTSTVKTFLGQGEGLFGQGSVATVGDAPIVLFSADLNRDEIPDLITGHGLSNDFSISFGDGDGFFSDPIFYQTEGNPWDFELKDVTGDENLDLVVAINDEEWEIAIYQGNGIGNFELFSTIPLNHQPLGITIADFNGDGANDLVTTLDKINIENIIVFQGNGLGLFTSVTTLSTMGIPGQIFNHDINKDGLPDLVVNDIRITTFLNNGIIADTKVVSAEGIFSIHPNPSDGNHCQIVFDNNKNTISNIVIMNQLGKTVYQTRSDFSQKTLIPLDNFESGIYWVRIENEEQIACEKLIVNR